MGKIVVSEFVSIDGVFEDPGGSEGTEHGGWSREYSNEEYASYKFQELKAADSLLLGRTTYEGFAAVWPTMEGTGEFGEKMNSLPKYVVTSNPEVLSWHNSHVIHGDLLEQIKKLKADSNGTILVAGSGQLVRYMLDNNLVDKLCLMVHPIVLGRGKQLLYGSDYSKFRLASSSTFKTGTIVLEYEQAI